MKAITKASVKRLNDYRDNPRIYIIGAMLANACAIYHDQEFEIADEFLKKYTTDTALVFTNYARHIISGMSSRFPDFIQTTFTHPYVMIIDESGALKALPLNPLASVLYETDKHGWPIMGTALLMKEAMTDEGPDIVSLNEMDTEVLRVIVNKAIKKWNV